MMRSLKPGSTSKLQRVTSLQIAMPDSICARVFPMHVRVPYPNGKNPFLAEVKSTDFPSKRSGLNSEGFSQMEGSRFMMLMGIRMSASLGIVMLASLMWVSSTQVRATLGMMA